LTTVKYLNHLHFCIPNNKINQTQAPLYSQQKKKSNAETQRKTHNPISLSLQAEPPSFLILCRTAVFSYSLPNRRISFLLLRHKKQRWVFCLKFSIFLYFFSVLSCSCDYLVFWLRDYKFRDYIMLWLFRDYKFCMLVILENVNFELELLRGCLGFWLK
jgi:hypothetical protein